MPRRKPGRQAPAVPDWTGVRTQRVEYEAATTIFAQGCLAGQGQRMATATAIMNCTVLSVEKQEMVRQLHAQPTFADRFLTHMLTRNIRIEEDLIDQLFNSSEKRLARTLLLLAR